MKRILILLSLLLLSLSAIAEKPVKPDALQAITSAQLADGDLYLLYDLSAGYTKKLTVAQLDARYGLAVATPTPEVRYDLWGFQAAEAADTTYYPIPRAPFGMQVLNFSAFCASGSITAKLQIAAANGSGATDITGCTAISVGTTKGTVTTCSTNSTNDLTSGKMLLLVTSANSSCLDFTPSILTSKDEN